MAGAVMQRGGANDEIRKCEIRINDEIRMTKSDWRHGRDGRGTQMGRLPGEGARA